MENKISKEIEETLRKKDIHQSWVNSYRTEENEPFFEKAFDYIVSAIDAPKNSIILDAGCGTCKHSIRLAKRGFIVKAIDFSESALEEAVINVRDNKLESKISIKRENICSLSFENEKFNYILCWGVLMHVPDLEKAISELARVLKPGGIIVIGENNMHSLQMAASRIRNKLFRKKMNDVEIKKTPAGNEYYWRKTNGMVMTRVIDMRWFVKKFESKGLIVKKRVARQFTETYISVSSPLFKRLIHIFNNIWFEYIKIPYLSHGNLLILQKTR